MIFTKRTPRSTNRRARRQFRANDGRSSRGMPEFTRRLNRPQMADLWSLTRQIGYAEPANGVAPINGRSVQPDADGVAYVITLTGDDDRWQFRTLSASAEAPGCAMPASAGVTLFDTDR